MKKIVLIILVALGTLPTSAKKNVIYEGFDIYDLDAGSNTKKSYFAFELGAGNELEMGFRYQKNFGKYFAWDIFGVKYALDYTISDDSFAHELTVETGIRAYSPAFARGKVKAFVSFDAGYGLSSCEYEYGYYDGWRGWQSEEEREINHHFAMDLTIGLQFKDKFYIGYGFGNLTGDISHSDHEARIGINF